MKMTKEEITKEEMLNRIPNDWLEFKSFIEKGNYYYETHKGFLIIDEVESMGRQYMIEIDIESSNIRFIDDLVDLESVLNHYNENLDIKEWKNQYSKLESEIAETGFHLNDAGNSGNEDYMWYEIAIEAHEFTEDNLKKASKLWTNFNNERRDLYSE